jgi:hypothetical protein
MLTAALVVLAAAAGVTGAWSPCGFSMVETARGVAARAAFALGALVGGAITFGGLSLLGALLGSGGTAALGLAAVVALAAAAGEAKGLRITPQIRRQVPESWRRVLPLPLASAGYGVLLGLGFTTFVLSFAVWALAALSIAVGDPLLGLAVGVAFGAGRALPVVVLAPGGALHTAMAERPSIYRALRLADALALLACAGALATTDAQAATTVHVVAATDPASNGGVLAWQQPGGPGQVNRAGRTDPLPGTFPTLGNDLLGWRESDRIVVADPLTLQRRGEIQASGLGPFAFNDRWAVWLAARAEGGEALLARSLAPGAGPDRVIAQAEPPASIGRPVLSGDLALFHMAGSRGSRIVEVDLVSGSVRHVRTALGALLLNPSVLGARIAYVRSTPLRQELRLGALAGSRVAEDALVYSTVPTGRRDNGAERRRTRHNSRPLPPRPAAGVQVTLWTTGIDARYAYVTRLVARPGTPLSSAILRTDLPPVGGRNRRG